MLHERLGEAVSHTKRLVRIESINDLDVADPGDGPAKPDELVSIQLIGPAELVDHMGDGLAGDRVPHVVGELVVLDHCTVAVLSAGGSEIHGCLHA